MTTSRITYADVAKAEIAFTILNTMRKVHHLVGAGAEASRGWWTTGKAELDGRTPSEAVIAGDHEAVARLVDSYLDPDFV